MDALPILEQTGKAYALEVDGIMHACGHDSHTAIALGAAMALSKFKDKLPRNIRFIFQPSEESKDGGSTQMIVEDVWTGLKRFLGYMSIPISILDKLDLNMVL